MSEMTEFGAFFKQHGVEFTPYVLDVNEEERRFVYFAGGANFQFDWRGNFLGVQEDSPRRNFYPKSVIT